MLSIIYIRLEASKGTPNSPQAITHIINVMEMCSHYHEGHYHMCVCVHVHMYRHISVSDEYSLLVSNISNKTIMIETKNSRYVAIPTYKHFKKHFSR
jgi:hypothetical protein